MKNFIAAVLCTTWVAVYVGESNSTLLTSKILGASEAEWNNNRHLVVIERHNVYFGSGALISIKHVITSPVVTASFHCKNYTGGYVRVGSKFIAGGKRYSIRDITDEREIEKIPTLNEAFFTIITLVKRIKEQDDAKPIPVSSEYVFPGTEAHVAGWGSILFVKDVLHTVLSDNLKELFVTILPNTKCIVHKSLNLSFNQMCARGLSDLPGGPYYGDIGDPLVATVNGKPMLIGIVHTFSRSFAFDTIYARLHAHYEYIVNTTYVPPITSNR